MITGGNFKLIHGGPALGDRSAQGLCGLRFAPVLPMGNSGIDRPKPQFCNETLRLFFDFCSFLYGWCG